MTTHRAHPTDTDNPRTVLFDHCPRCTEHADDPTGVDDTTLARLWAVMLAVDLDDDHRPLTSPELDAVGWLRRVRHVAARLGFVPSLTDLAANR
jgi:hypothetical protein